MRIKLATIWITLLISLFLLLPSMLPENSPLLRFLPGKKINLGLDLRGGIHVVLGVEIQKALDVELDKFFVDLQNRLAEKQIVVSKIERLHAERAIAITFRSDQDEKTFEKLLKDDFYNVLNISNINGLTARVILEPTHEKYIATMSLEQAREIIRNRVDEFGVAEPIIQLQGSDRILVQLPGVQDPERALQLIGRTALLEFKLVDDSLPPAQIDALVEKFRVQTGFKNNFTKAELDKLNAALKKDLPAGTEVSFEKVSDPRSKDIILRPYLLRSTTVLTGAALEDARVTVEQTSQRPQVSLKFSKAGAESFEKITEGNVGKLLAILLDGVVVSAPVIRERIPALSAGATVSLGRGTRKQMQQEAKDLALVLRSGALPAPVEILENRTVGASLGDESIDKGKFSGILGSLLVILFMAIYYRWSGVLADVVLVVHIFMLLAFMALFQATLTMPGIAGIVLTVGMGVDANVIILERIREELRSGKRRLGAVVEAGYDEAHRAIFDSNLTTLLSGFILYQFGSGPIKGFAVTLIAGIICNYIAAVWFSRWIYEWYFSRFQVNKLSI
ncbi:MAG: protein translocase subunit SecD [Deltaproteobacteria bacterium]|nr:protein translocase subunit SecD [Deltaproteobacteria bacterium]